MVQQEDILEAEDGGRGKGGGSWCVGLGEVVCCCGDTGSTMALRVLPANP